MVQSVKRALKADPDHPELHSCLIRLFRFLEEGKLLSDTVSNAAVAAVLQTESQTLFNNMDASQLNKQFLEHKANSLPHLLQGRYNFFSPLSLLVIDFTLAQRIITLLKWHIHARFHLNRLQERNLCAC